MQLREYPNIQEYEEILAQKTGGGVNLVIPVGMQISEELTINKAKSVTRALEML